MGKVTLVCSSLAVPGMVFTYIGEEDPCGSCDVRAVCHNLEKGSRYRIVEVREKEHDCLVHEGGKVRVVECEEPPREISIPKKKCMEGAVLTLDEFDCPHTWCVNNWLCRGKGKVRIETIGEELECPISLKLHRCVIKEVG